MSCDFFFVVCDFELEHKFDLITTNTKGGSLSRPRLVSNLKVLSTSRLNRLTGVQSSL